MPKKGFKNGKYSAQTGLTFLNLKTTMCKISQVPSNAWINFIHKCLGNHLRNLQRVDLPGKKSATYVNKFIHPLKGTYFLNPPYII